MCSKLNYARFPKSGGRNFMFALNSKIGILHMPYIQDKKYLWELYMCNIFHILMHTCHNLYGSVNNDDKLVITIHCLYMQNTCCGTFIVTSPVSSAFLL